MTCVKFDEMLLGNVQKEITDYLSSLGYDVTNIIFKYDKLKLYTNIIKNDVFSAVNNENTAYSKYGKEMSLYLSHDSNYKLTKKDVIFYELDKSEIINIFTHGEENINIDVNTDDYNSLNLRLRAQLTFGHFDDENWNSDTIDICDNVIKMQETSSQSIRQNSIKSISTIYNKMQNKRAYLPRCVLIAIINCT